MANSKVLVHLNTGVLSIIFNNMVPLVLINLLLEHIENGNSVSVKTSTLKKITILAVTLKHTFQNVNL